LIIFDERRLRALHNVELYQGLISRAFDKKVRPTGLQEGDMVLKEIRAIIQGQREMSRLNWSGLFIIKTILPGGAVKLMNLDGEEYNRYKILIN